MERGALKGHGALLLANVIWGLNSPICKTVLLSPENPEGLNHFALTVYRLVGAFLLFWLASAFLPRERVAWRDLGDCSSPRSSASSSTRFFSSGDSPSPRRSMFRSSPPRYPSSR